MTSRKEIYMMNEQTEKNILKVLESLGELIQRRDSEIYSQNLRLEYLEEKIQRAEEELRLTREALNRESAENRHLRDQLGLDIAPAGELKGA
jgi:hypothetical protein